VNVTMQYYGVIRERFTRVSKESVHLSPGADLTTLAETLAERHPGLGAALGHVRIAVNEEFAARDTLLHDGDVVVLIPPTAGGSDPYCRLTERPLSVDEALAAVRGPDHGATVVFVGYVRDTNDGHSVVRLDYEAYESMALRGLLDIIGKCEAMATGVRVGVAHRLGTLHVGDMAVVVAAGAAHRGEAFDAARECIELLKANVPIWKKEHSPDGEEWVGFGP
jgi:molybdopterin synthase catalytic subunit